MEPIYFCVFVLSSVLYFKCSWSELVLLFFRIVHLSITWKSIVWQRGVTAGAYCLHLCDMCTVGSFSIDFSDFSLAEVQLGRQPVWGDVIALRRRGSRCVNPVDREAFPPALLVSLIELFTLKCTHIYVHLELNTWSLCVRAALLHAVYSVL